MLECSFQIRLVEERYFDQVEYINLACLPENYSRFFYRDLYHRFSKTFLLALVNDRVVGYIMCRMETGLSEIKRLGLAKKGHVVSLAVLPEFRKKGIGRGLAMGSLRGMIKYGASESYLEVRISNDSAINLYKKLEFKPTRRIIGYYRDGEDAYVMCRKLEKEVDFGF